MEFLPFIEIFLVSYCLSSISTNLTIKFAAAKQIIEANNYRKLHLEKVAALGGIPIFLAFLITSSLVVQDYLIGIPFICHLSRLPAFF